MLRGLYTAGAGMIAQQRKQEMLTNNMSNIETPGYKADQASMRKFPNMLIQALGTQQNGPGSSVVGELTTGVYLQEQTPNFRQGDMQETGNNTDIALLQALVPVNEAGEEAMLAYEVQNEAGEVRYSRNGNFAVDAQGFLTTPAGYYVQGTDGEPINTGNENFRVDEAGNVLGAEDELLGQINIAVIPDPVQLVKEGQGLLNYEGEEEIVTAVNNAEVTYQLQQGFVERSNVDAQQTMTEMMNAMRTFEANQKMLQAYDQSLERAVNDIGRIS
ncbi:flagellar hook-basal body protein [Alkalicoccus daliensis]|uniref:Flagellar basal-body rod protein FlgG n=1 Tax=Alkalicoccus daliensis TaxID=745820 RepID=A0A1H0GKE9_9BACI|nr:flagellar hook-basal body protein [Alkalicoccus daliensis]SDO07426.1 flagellar basal-body rod protein FlgG [Alkalicoccus daliensis]